MTLSKRIALFAASVAVIGAGTLAATAQPASAAPLIASQQIIADHDGGQGWSGDRDRGSYDGNHDRGSQYGDRGRDGDRDFRHDRDDHRYFHRGGDRDYRDADRDYRHDGDRDWHDRDRHDDSFNLSIHL